MLQSIPLTPAQQSNWATIQRTLLTSKGAPNPIMIEAYAKAYTNHMSNEGTYGPIHYEKIVSFLKTYPDMLTNVFPTLYKKASQEKQVVDLIHSVHEHHPGLLRELLLSMFSKEKNLSSQITLLMTISQYVEPSIFQKLDLSTIRKAAPAKLLKAFTPTPHTWEGFMKLAKLLSQNEENEKISKQIAYSVGIQISISKVKDQKHHGIERYDWVEAFECWERHYFQWNVIEMLTDSQERSKGFSLVADTLISLYQKEALYTDKILELFHWLNNPEEQIKNPIRLYVPADKMDNTVLDLYLQTTHPKIKEACIAWIDQRSSDYCAHHRTWKEMPTQDFVRATNHLVHTTLLPIGWTKAQCLLPIIRGPASENMSLQRRLGSTYFSVLNKTDLPLGDLNAALLVIRKKWFDEFKAATPSQIARGPFQAILTSGLKPLFDDMQTATKKALQNSNNFKLLLLYTAYQTAKNEKDWFLYDHLQFPDTSEMPFAALSLVYPEYQDHWAMVQEKILNRTFDRSATFQLIAKVLFDKNLTVSEVDTLCDALGNPVETFFETLETTENDIFLPSTLDFNVME